MAYNGKKAQFKVNLDDRTPFERRVLFEVMKIPRGEIRTYKNIADAVGTNAYRVVGTALSKNPLPIIIPCHRVVKSDLNIGGYKGGMEMKKEILENEGLCILNDKILLKNKNI